MAVEEDDIATHSGVEKAIVRAEMDYWNFQKDKDLTGIRTLMHRDLVAWPSWSEKPQPIADLARIRPSYQDVDSYELTPERIDVRGHDAFIFYSVRWTDPQGEKHNARVGHFWVKEEGSWLLLWGYSDEARGDA